MCARVAPASEPVGIPAARAPTVPFVGQEEMEDDWNDQQQLSEEARRYEGSFVAYEDLPVEQLEGAALQCFAQLRLAC